MKNCIVFILTSGNMPKERTGSCLRGRMYSPHHTPWTIEGTKEFFKIFIPLDGNTITTTVNIGHMTVQPLV